MTKSPLLNIPGQTSRAANAKARVTEAKGNWHNTTCARGASSLKKRSALGASDVSVNDVFPGTCF